MGIEACADGGPADREFFERGQRGRNDGLGMLQLRVSGGEVIEQAPVGAEIEVALNLDSAIILAD